MKSRLRTVDWNYDLSFYGKIISKHQTFKVTSLTQDAEKVAKSEGIN